jgi:hypothetical protein
MKISIPRFAFSEPTTDPARHPDGYAAQLMTPRSRRVPGETTVLD